MSEPRVITAAVGFMEEIGRALRSGEVVALPTDTVYGLVCRPESAERLFSLKGRSSDVNVQVLIGRTRVARSISTFPLLAERLAHRFWPGALTLVAKRTPDNHWNLGADRETIGIRSPMHSVMFPLCLVHGPLAATSANLHGEPVATSAEEIAATFPGGSEGVSLILDRGECGGVASTVVDVTGSEPRCLRQGAISWGDILAAVEEGTRDTYY